MNIKSLEQINDINQNIEKSKDPLTTKKTTENEQNDLNKRKKEDVYKEDLMNIVKHVFDEADIPEKFEAWSYQKQHDWVEKGCKELLGVPESVAFVLPAMVRDGDCGRSPLDKPDWLDMEKFRRGQKFIMDHFFGHSFSMVLGLYVLFSAADNLRPLILTRKSATPFLSFKRFLSTLRRMRNWYLTDPWTKGTSAFKDMQSVQSMHRSMRRKLCEQTNEEIYANTQIPDACCPMRSTFLKDLRSAIPEVGKTQVSFKVLEDYPDRPKTLNQADMMATQFAFSGFFLLFPKAFGVHHATEEDFEAFCHLWRGLGYLLGIEDEFNFCKGSVDEIRQRSRDMIEVFLKPCLRDINPEWEHMTRNMVEGIKYYVPMLSFKQGMLYIMELLEIPMPAFYSTFSFWGRLYYSIFKFLFYYAARSNIILQFLNKAFNWTIDRAMHYSPLKLAKLEEKSAKTLLDLSASQILIH